MRPSAVSNRTVGVAVAVWLGVVAGGFVAWEWAEATPGQVGRPADGGGPAVAVYVHPHCPCTRAALPELAAVLAAAPAGADVRVLFVRPAGVPAGWERTRSWAIVGDRAAVDDGERAAADGAHTSGHVVARDAGGRVVFRGGLTRPGDRSGDGVGLRAVADVLAGRVPATGEAPVFGCPLGG